MNGVPKLDWIDLNILVQLQNDGRMTNDLAEAAGFRRAHAEMALSVLAYNLMGVINIVGVKALIAAIAT